MCSKQKQIIKKTSMVLNPTESYQPNSQTPIQQRSHTCHFGHLNKLTPTAHDVANNIQGTCNFHNNDVNNSTIKITQGSSSPQFILLEIFLPPIDLQIYEQ